jgi:hypothetical protein
MGEREWKAVVALVVLTLSVVATALVLTSTPVLYSTTVASALLVLLPLSALGLSLAAIGPGRTRLGTESGDRLGIAVACVSVPVLLVGIGVAVLMAGTY